MGATGPVGFSAGWKEKRREVVPRPGRPGKRARGLGRLPVGTVAKGEWRKSRTTPTRREKWPECKEARKRNRRRRRVRCLGPMSPLAPAAEGKRIYKPAPGGSQGRALGGQPGEWCQRGTQGGFGTVPSTALGGLGPGGGGGIHDAALPAFGISWTNGSPVHVVFGKGNQVKATGRWRAPQVAQAVGFLAGIPGFPPQVLYAVATPKQGGVRLSRGRCCCPLPIDPGAPKPCRLNGERYRKRLRGPSVSRREQRLPLPVCQPWRFGICENERMHTACHGV